MQKKRSRPCAVPQLLLGSLVAGLISTFSMSAEAADTFSNAGIQFDVDTIVEFEFVESNGAFESTFGVINLETGEKTPLVTEAKSSNNPQDVQEPSDFEDDTQSSNKDDFHGTPGDAVLQPLTEFRFKGNTRYAFYLESFYKGRPAGILYSTDSRNPNGNQQAQFEGGLSALESGGSLIRWDDTGIIKALQERDFDDFVVRAGGHETCPYDRNVTSQSQAKEQSEKLGSQLKDNQASHCYSSRQVQK